MTHVTPKENESAEAMLKRFTKKVNNAGILQEVKRRRYYEKPSDKRRREKAAGKARAAKQRKKVEAFIKFHSENKIRPRKPRPVENKDNRRNEQKVYRAPHKKPKVVHKPVTNDSLKKLQDKFSK